MNEIFEKLYPLLNLPEDRVIQKDCSALSMMIPDRVSPVECRRYMSTKLLTSEKLALKDVIVDDMIEEMAEYINNTIKRYLRGSRRILLLWREVPFLREEPDSFLSNHERLYLQLRIGIGRIRS